MNRTPAILATCLIPLSLTACGEDAQEPSTTPATTTQATTTNTTTQSATTQSTTPTTETTPPTKTAAASFAAGDPALIATGNTINNKVGIFLDPNASSPNGKNYYYCNGAEETAPGAQVAAGECAGPYTWQEAGVLAEHEGNAMMAAAADVFNDAIDDIHSEAVKSGYADPNEPVEHVSVPEPSGGAAVNGYGTAPNGARNPTSSELQTQWGCKTGTVTDAELCASVESVVRAADPDGSTYR